jgi:RNA polymerase primary sigma factor
MATPKTADTLEQATAPDEVAPAAKAPAKRAPAKKTAAKAAPKRATKAKAKSDDDDEEIEPGDEAEVDVVEEVADDTEAVSDDESSDTEEGGKVKPAAVAETLPTGALVLSLVDDEDDVPVYSSTITGATADPVKDYLKQIGKVALLKWRKTASVPRATCSARTSASSCRSPSATPAAECSSST